MTNYVEAFANKFPEVNVVSDMDWKLDKNTSRPLRGLHDYDREITFDRFLTLEELTNVKKYLHEEAYSREIGWTEVHCYVVKGFTYKFRTTWDSSD